MFAKKITASLAVLVTTAAISAPAFADRGHRYGHGQRYVQHYKVKHHYHDYRPAPRPVVVHHYYRPAPPPVYVVRQDPVVPLLVGAVIGAAIVHSATVGY